MTDSGREIVKIGIGRPTPNPRELGRPKLNLEEIKTSLIQHGIEIPAGQGREPVRILPRPAFMKWEHGINLVELDVMKTRKTPPVIFGVYAIGIGIPPKEVRFIKLPVQTDINGGVFRDAEDRIIREIVEDGFERREVEQLTNERKTQPVLGLVDGRTFLSLTRALQYQHFVNNAIPYEYQEYGERSRLQSGWKEGDSWPLVAFSNWKAQVEVLFGYENKTIITGESIISDPVSQQALDSADPAMTNLVGRILQKNR